MDNRRDLIHDGSTVSDFAITTVNVPDRLDVQEVRARAEEDADSARPRHFDWSLLQRWVLGLGFVAVLTAAAYYAFINLSPLRARLSADGIATQISAALGERARVANAGIRLVPTPRLVVEGIDAGGRFRIDSVSFRFSWVSLAQAIRSGVWVWGDASVGPMEISPEAAFTLIRAVPALSGVVPSSIRTIRFESVRFPQAHLLPSRYEIVATRSQGNGPFTEFEMGDLDTRGRMELGISLTARDAARFRLRAVQWRPPVGPAVEWSEAAADGSFAPGRLQIDSFSANGFLGVVSGSLTAHESSGWHVGGIAQASNIDLTAVQHEVRRRVRASSPQSEVLPALQGLMELRASLAGQGATLPEALERLSATGKLRLRFAALNGTNLGATAVLQGGQGGLGGVTRFGDFEAAIDAGPEAVRVRDIAANAGALRVRGVVGIDRALSLGGVLRAEVTSAGGVAAADVRVSGTALDPLFDR